MQDRVDVVDRGRRETGGQPVGIEPLHVSGRELGQAQIADDADDVQAGHVPVAPCR